MPSAGLSEILYRNGVGQGSYFSARRIFRHSRAVPAPVFVIPRRSSARSHISVPDGPESWKIGLKSDCFRNGTPGDPPVPCFAPIVRSTNLM